MRYKPVDTEMLDVRWKYLHFRNELPAPVYSLSKVKCPACFARLVLS